jgi:hypothetical protein
MMANRDAVMIVSKTCMFPAGNLGLAELPIPMVEPSPSSYRIAHGRALSPATSQPAYKGVFP